MSGRLTRNGWVVALCGILYAVISVMYLDHSAGGFRTSDSILLAGIVSLAAGMCSIAAGTGKFVRGERWPWLLNGLALFALGMLLSGFAGPRVSLRVIAMLVIVMATSTGILEIVTARGLRKGGRSVFFWVAGAASLGFAAVFLALGLGWMIPRPGSSPELVWLGFYFGLSAICTLVMSRPHSRLRQPSALPRHP